MPSIKNKDATIYYEEHGKGFPILTFAPAGLQSTIKVWSGSSAPINPITEWSGSRSARPSAQRSSNTTCEPSFQPSAPSASLNAGNLGAADSRERKLSQPIRIGGFLDWPKTAPVHASAGHAAAVTRNARRPEWREFPPPGEGA